MGLCDFEGKESGQSAVLSTQWEFRLTTKRWIVLGFVSCPGGTERSMEQLNEISNNEQACLPFTSLRLAGREC